jgi:DNA-binding beta-propeller fold protein YncE
VTRSRIALTTLCAALLAGAALWAAPAVAKDRLYWTPSSYVPPGHYNGGEPRTPQDKNHIYFANTDGSGEIRELSTRGATVNKPRSLAIDPVAGRVYWANIGAQTISFARLDGSGGGDLFPTGNGNDALLSFALDRAGGRFYWANYDASFNESYLVYRSLDGTTSGTVPTSGAIIDRPLGLAVDSKAGRIYWANYSAAPISYARLDRTGGDDLATSDDPNHQYSGFGLALDPVAGRAYWLHPFWIAASGQDTSTVSWANLDNSGGDYIHAGPRYIPPLTDFPYEGGLAIDRGGGQILWPLADYGMFASKQLGGDGVAVLPIASNGDSVALLKAPIATAKPTVTRAAGHPSTLTCSPGSWASDLPGTGVYGEREGPLRYSWTRHQNPVPGGTRATFTPRVAGDYRCSVTAANAADATTQTSAPFVVAGGSARAAAKRPSRRSAPARLSTAATKLPNLEVAAASDPTPPPTFEAVAVANVGGVRASASQVGFFLSRDRRRGSGDVKLGVRISFDAIASGKHTTRSKRVGVPAGTRSGFYYLIACADIARKVSESNERDNCRATKFPLWVPGPQPNALPTAVLETAAECNNGAFSAASVPYCHRPGPTWTFRATHSSDPERRLASWRVDFGDGTSKTGAFAAAPPSAVVHRYTTAGFYRVVLTVTDRAGRTAHDVAFILATPTAYLEFKNDDCPTDWSHSPSYSCPSGNWHFRASGSSAIDGITGWKLVFGDGSVTTFTSPPSDYPDGMGHTYTCNGTYTAKLTITDGLGVSAVDTKRITISNWYTC